MIPAPHKNPSPNPAATAQLLPSSQAGAALLAAIAGKALPWLEGDAQERFVIVRPNYKEMQQVAGNLPGGVEVSSRPIRTRRVIVRDRPVGIRFISATWPGEGLEAKCYPMIACTLSGPADLRVSDYVLHCKEGNFIFLPAGIPHPDSSRVHLEGENQNRRSCDVLWFSPIGEVLRCWMCRSENGRHSSFQTLYFDSKKLVSYCEWLFEELNEGDAIDRKIRRGLMIALLSSVQKEIQAARFFRWLPQSVTLSPEEDANPIKRAQNYIRQHLGEHLTLERVARQAHMSRSQFAKKFHHETGETFTAFLTRCRLEEAKMRLSTTTAQIAGLSRHVGLKPRYFAQMFQQHTGMTPGEYRRKSHQEPESSKTDS